MLAAASMRVPAQEHGEHSQDKPQDTRQPHGQAHESMMDQSMMEAIMGPLGISLAREGSGTSWLPDATPMYALHSMKGPWLLMLHGNAFLQYLDEGGDRGDEDFGSINWLMGMARRKVGEGDFMLRAMLSAEPDTIGECGYPDLLATGESCRGGRELHDRQHPHDLFMEIAAKYERPLTEALGIELYGGPVGEPALGPTAYPHRLSALPSPIAPIGHHWFDSTHISFGVVTAGLFGKRWKIEGSVFNGREPDENRYDLDLDPLDSYSGRVWFLPNERWALQVSIGRLKEAEPARNGRPAQDIRRPTASATYHQPLAQGGTWATTAAWGQNREGDEHTNAYLIETNLNLAERHIVFARAEFVEKSGDDLVLEDQMLADRIFNISTVGAGYVYQFAPLGNFVPSAGVRAAVSFVPSALEPFYGSRSPTSFGVFVSVRPRPMEMASMDSVKEHEMPRGGHVQPRPGQSDMQR